MLKKSNFFENTYIKTEPPDSDLDDINSECSVDNPIKIEPPDSDDANEDFHKESDFNFSTKQETSNNFNFKLEPGVSRIKTEPGLDVKCDQGIENRGVDRDESSKEEFAVCFWNLKTSERKMVKKLILCVLEPKDIVDLISVKEKQKKFIFLKVATRIAFEKIMRCKAKSVIGQKIEVRNVDLIKIKMGSSASNDLKLISPEERIKRRLINGDVKQSTSKKKKRDDKLCEIKKNVEPNKGGDEAKLCKNVGTDESEEAKSCTRYRVVFGNVKITTTDEQIKTFMKSVISPQQITRLFRLSQIKSIVFVDLANQEAVEKVVSLSGRDLNGSTVRIVRSLQVK